MSKHTPGPWNICTVDGDQTVVTSKSDFLVAQILYQGAFFSSGEFSVEETFDANARLIAAAPELLDALKLCEGNISSLLASAHPKVFGVWLEVVRAAIAKATGGAS